MNKVVFIGRLTKEAELQTVGDNTVCNFTLARNRGYQKDKDHPEADFIDCVAWNKTAEILSKYFSKGDRVGIVGSLQTRTYEDKDGSKRKTTKILVETLEFIETKGGKQTPTNSTDMIESKSNTDDTSSFNSDEDTDYPF